MEYEIIDHGKEASDYFQGCGTCFTDFNHVVTGCGFNQKEAYEDAVEQIYDFYLENEIDYSNFNLPKKPKGFRKKNAVTIKEAENNVYWYVSVRFNF
ncbi:hypothetical protein M0R19_09340 [Candidatus Pacearchaeota archaeon]|nr:hypothetical protein [Candidatus Pacearchaeota archaeon]